LLQIAIALLSTGEAEKKEEAIAGVEVLPG
jgi:hypothetical protein